MRGCHASRTGIGRSSQPGLQECGGGHFRGLGVGRRGTGKAVADAIYTYEPRLIPGTVTVKSVRGAEQMSLNALMFEIEADLWAQPVPLHLYLQTEVDLETGHFTTARQLP